MPSQLAYRLLSANEDVDALQHPSSQVEMTRVFMDPIQLQTVSAVDRPGFSALLAHAAAGDRLHVSSIALLGKDIRDIRAIVYEFLDRGVLILVPRLGSIGRFNGDLILATLTQLCDMPDDSAKQPPLRSLQAEPLQKAADTQTLTAHSRRGRPKLGHPTTVKAWRVAQRATIAATAARFGLSHATVKRYCAA